MDSTFLFWWNDTSSSLFQVQMMMVQVNIFTTDNTTLNQKEIDFYTVLQSPQKQEVFTQFHRNIISIETCCLFWPYFRKCNNSLHPNIVMFFELPNFQPLHSGGGIYNKSFHTKDIAQKMKKIVCLLSFISWTKRMTDIPD